MIRARKKKITWYLTTETLCQVYRRGLEYAFVSKDYKQVCPFVYCKDFLQDALQGHLHGIYREIYGFVYNPKKHSPLYTDKIRLLLACSRDVDFRSKIPHCVDFLNQIEQEMHFKKTCAWECANPPAKYQYGGIWLFEGSHRWLKSPPLLSMYTLLIRAGFVHTKGKGYKETIQNIINKKIKPYQTADASQLKKSINGIENIIRNKDKIFYKEMKDNFPSYIGIETMHHYLGIVNFSKGQTKDWFPYWHRKKI